ncbi:E3 SUMO-protein ligase RanBP2 [Drosophila novamexicana]|uniref:E3 SUMO-protein ligase RanBP2 n=1 Tax=Drosophila novamexicana TaxID=47314 RepID=UPI0011E601E1|nr:E3 SUMO-protein ligase RanBP2 [Drosophila novamexicana]
MFTTRKEVDEHVHKMFSKVPPGPERDMKGWAVGRLYSKIQEYAKAIEHLNAFLKVNDDAGAHKLIARCYKQLKNPDYQKAFEHYQRSIQLNPKQSDVINECCRMLYEQKTLCTPDRVSYWLELASTVEDLQESELLLVLRMRSSAGTVGWAELDNSMELVIKKELLTRPHNTLLQLRLLQTYLEKKRIDEAFNYAYKTELEFPAHSQSTEWYDVVSTVLQKCESKETSKDWPYWQLLLITFDRLLQLNLQSDASNSLGESIAQLFKLDQYVYKFSLLADQLSINGSRELHQYCLEHYAGQLFLHAVTVLFKREILGNKNKWSITVRAALPLMLLGYQQNLHEAKSSYWQRHCNSVQQKLLNLWRHQAAFRCAQLGRTLLGCVQIPIDDAGQNDLWESQLQGLWPNSDELLAAARQHCVDSQWRSQLYQQLYTHPENKLKEQSSYLVRDQRLQQPLYEWPSLAQIEEHEQLALQLTPSTLEHHVYLALSTDNLAEAPRVHFYKALRRDCKQPLSNCSVDTLSQVDVDIFLYAVVLQAQRKMNVQRESYNSYHVGNRSAAARPYMLPFANIMGHNELITPEQNRWWTVMQRIHDNIDIGENHRIEHRDHLQFGLEVVRCQNEPHIEIIMLLQLGKLLASREDCANLETRIEAFYKLGISMMIRHQEHKLEPFYRYFKYMNINASSVWIQVKQLAEEALAYLSKRSIKLGNHQEFVKDIHGLKLPMATYLQAEAYRQLADSSHTSRVARQNFQERRIECLRETKVLLGNNHEHPLSSVVQRELKNSLADERYGSPELHNNSSTYEDAEDDYYTGAAQSLNRSRRQLESQSPATLHLEQTIKLISKQLCVLKDNVGGNLEAMRQDIKTISEKFDMIEELLKKLKTNGGCSHEVQSRDVDAAAAAAALGLDDFLNMDDAIQTNYLNSVPPTHNAQERLYPSGSATQPNAAYGSPMFNQNQMYNYFASQAQFMRTPPAASNMPSNLYGPRPPASFSVPPNMYPNPTGAPFIESLNYGIAAPPPSLVLPQVSQAQSYNHHPVPQNVNMASGANFFNTAQFLPSNVQIPQPVPQPAQQLQPPVQAPLQQHKPTIGTTTSITLASATGTAAVTAPVDASPAAAAPALAPSAGGASSTIFNRALNNQPVEKEPPANVVITSSDPLPKTAVASAQPTLSVTIPPQHIKPSLVQSAEPAAVGGSDFNFSLGNNNAGNIFSGLPTSTFSFKTQVAQAAAEKQKELAADAANNDSVVSEPNNGLAGDASAELDYDPRPDFQGIIPLPAEVEVRTGEEDEKVNFSHRAKLFRHVDKEWKERGIGIIKILTNQTSGCTRILMRREQTHKICANHKITSGMTLTTPEQDKEEKSFLWAANDFADEKLKVEKFLVRFKLAETAKDFKLAFEQAARETKTNEIKPPVFGLAKSSAINSFVTSTPAASALPKQIEPVKVGKVEPKVDAVVPKTLFGNLPGTTNAATSSPFANFNFGTTSKGTKPSVNLSFGSVSVVTDTSSSNTAFTTAFNFGSNLFSKPAVQSEQHAGPQLQTQNQSTASDVEPEEEYVPTAQFAPVIPLPELVEVVTGEEDELVLFEHRAKLLRFDKKTNEWKERGLGNIKLLQKKTDPSLVRLLMRREQVLKVCCNQRLQPDAKFSYLNNTQNALTWAAPDYAEQEMTTELLCVRFKTAEICKEFYDSVLKAQAVMSQEKPNPEPQNKQIDKNVNKDTENETHGFGDAFKPKAGSWNCKGCYTNNDAAQLYCVACETPKDDTVPPKSATLDQSGVLNLSSSAGKFTFGFGQSTATKSFSVDTKTALEKLPPPADPLAATTNVASDINFGDAVTTKLTASVSDKPKAVGFGDAFKPKTGSWDCKDCYTLNDVAQLYCLACQAPKDDNVPKKDNKLDGSGGINFPASSSKYTFGFGAVPVESTKSIGGSSSDSITNVMPKKNIEGNIFNSASFNFKPTTVTSSSNLVSNTFSFSMPKIHQQPKSPIGVSGGADVSNDDESHVDEEENNAYFAPVIPLPDKIDVRTGEEDEFLLYVQRAKLYRLTEAGEWKERGLGDLKILRHKETKNLRVVMRREKVLKICLNHVLNSSVVYKPKDEKTWLFAVHDFSEGESVLERFALRFKNADIAQVFYNTVKCALNGTAEPICDEENQQQEQLNATPSKPDDEPDISNEIQTLANKLTLSCEFLTTQSSCSGCRGCEPENFDYGHPAKDEVAIKPLPLTLPALKLPTPKEQDQFPGQEGAASPNRGLLKASTLAANSTTNKFGSFGGFSSAVSANSTVTSAASPNQTETKSVGLGGGFLFGNPEKPVFGLSASLFGGNNAAKPQQSVFGGLSGEENKYSSQTNSIFGSTGIPQISNQEEVPKSIFSPFGDSSFKNSNSSPGFTFGTISGSSVALSFDSQVRDKTITVAETANSQEQTKDNKENIAETSGTNPGISPSSLDQKTVSCFSDLAAKAGDDFASLAAKGTSNPIGFQKSDTGGYFGLTHQDDFKNFKSPTAKEDNTTESVNDDDNYDPHYEPIIALPNEIVVSTGEENEVKLFGERATLFRFNSDSKEWKERGVGELKILKHTTLNTCRMVMRREQIHKLVLNMKISKSFTMEYMNGQKKSFIWANFNYAESSDGVVERLACRFKKQELADKFHETIEQCVADAKASSSGEEPNQKDAFVET